MQLRFYPRFSWCAREDVNGPLIHYTCLPLPFIHMRDRCHVAVGDIATNNKWRMMNYGKPGKPSHCLPLSFLYMRSRCHISWQWNNDVGWRQHGEDMIISPLTTRTTLQLLLPCQLTCALHTWGINIAHDPWMYPSWVFNSWNPMYTLTRTCRLPRPVSRVRVSGRYGYRSSRSHPGVIRANH